jgi:hypothetical protein
MGCENPEALRTLSNLIIELTSEGFVFEKYMNMCADPENNALFNSGPLNKPVIYVMWNYFIVLCHNRI